VAAVGSQLIVTSELTQEGVDQTQLFAMGKKAKETLGTKSMNLLADAGYSNGEQLQECLVRIRIQVEHQFVANLNSHSQAS
jgi:hypothetical protein